MHPDRFQVEALAAGGNTDLLIEQARRYQPKKISVGSKELADKVAPYVPAGTKLYYGSEGLIEIAAGTEAETVVTAVVGSVGLESTLAAIESGKQIGLANKETLVTAGHIVTAKARKKGFPFYL